MKKLNYFVNYDILSSTKFSELQIRIVPTNTQFCHLCVPLLISSYMFQLNYHHREANTYITKTYNSQF